MLKLSRYNWLIKADNDYLLSNGLTGAIALLDTKNVNQIKKLLNQDSDVQECIACTDDKIVSQLVKAGVLVDIGFDERLYMQYRYEITKHSKVQGYTVVPTIRCNFACPYCYEEGGQNCIEDMSDSIIDKIVELAAKAKGDEFSIVATGGEPTLIPDKLLSIYSRVQHVTQDRGAKFKGRLVTNGFLLDSMLSKKLRDYGVEELQVTLDGDRSLHNSRRPHKSGEGTFDKIVANICNAAEHINMINIRVNIEYDEFNQYEYVRDLFKEFSNVDVYFAPTVYPDNITNRTDKNYVHYSNMCKNKSIQSLKKRTSFSMPICCAVQPDTCVILPDGSLTRCWNQIAGKYKAQYGQLSSAKTNYQQYLPWVTYNPYLPDSPCYDCKLLPNCAGGCPADWILGNNKSCPNSEFAGNYSTYVRNLYTELCSSEGGER